MSHYDHDAPLYGMGPLDPPAEDSDLDTVAADEADARMAANGEWARHMMEDTLSDADTRTCSTCGNPWPDQWDACMRPECKVGRENIADTKGDLAYHLAHDY